MKLNTKEVEALRIVLDYVECFNKQDKDETVAEAASVLEFLMEE
jgi:hypothetical protein